MPLAGLDDEGGPFPDRVLFAQPLDFAPPFAYRDDLQRMNDATFFP